MKKLLWGLSILAGAFVVAIVLRGGSGGVTEFSPDTLEHRSQSEILCPVIEVPLFRGPLEYYEHELVRFLVKKGYWQPRKVDSPRWLLLAHWNRVWRDGDSVLGHELFGRKASWIEWTEKIRRRRPSYGLTFSNCCASGIRSKPWSYFAKFGYS